MAFHPASLEVARGDTVVWINRDLVPHSATGRDRGWTTGVLARDREGRRVAGRAGEVRYFCELHPVMTGRIVVR